MVVGRASYPHDRSLLSGYNPKGGFYNIEFHAMPYGLYSYGDNSIIHLPYYSINEDEWQLVVEKFNTQDQTLEDYFGINNLNISSYQPDKLLPWFDQDGYIYF